MQNPSSVQEQIEKKKEEVSNALNTLKEQHQKYIEALLDTMIYVQDAHKLQNQDPNNLAPLQQKIQELTKQNAQLNLEVINLKEKLTLTTESYKAMQHSTDQQIKAQIENKTLLQTQQEKIQQLEIENFELKQKVRDSQSMQAFTQRGLSGITTAAPQPTETTTTPTQEQTQSFEFK